MSSIMILSPSKSKIFCLSFGYHKKLPALGVLSFHDNGENLLVTQMAGYVICSLHWEVFMLGCFINSNHLDLKII